MPATRLAIVTTLCVGTALGGFAGSVTAAEDPHACVSIADNAARLACYDRALGRASAAKAAPAASARTGGRGTAPVPPSAAAPAAAAPVVAAAPAAKNPEAEFGLNEAARRAKDPAKAAEAAAVPESVSGRVISVGWRKYGEFVVTLDNGQVWEQNEPMPSAIVKVGDTVTIKKAWLGSFMLVTAGRVGTKVHRVD